MRANWRSSILNYKAVKKQLSAGGSDTTTTFVATLQGSVDAANSYIADARNEHLVLLAHLESLHAELDSALAPAGGAVACAKVADDRNSIDVCERRLWDICRDAHDFSELAYTAFYKSLKKHDKVTGKALLAPLLRTIESQPFLAPLIFPSQVGTGASGSVTDSAAQSGGSSEVDEAREVASAALPSVSLADAVSFAEAIPRNPAQPLRLHVFRSIPNSIKPVADEGEGDTDDDSYEPSGGETHRSGGLAIMANEESLREEESPLMPGGDKFSTTTTILQPVASSSSLDAIIEVTTLEHHSRCSTASQAAGPAVRPLLPQSESRASLKSGSHLGDSDQPSNSDNEALDKFSAAMSSLFVLSSSALEAAAPELAQDADATNRLQALRAAMLSARKKLSSLPLHSPERVEAEAAEKHYAFELAARALAAQFALAQPEHAAALDFLVAAHHTLFSSENPNVPPPNADHAALLAGLLPHRIRQASCMRTSSSRESLSQAATPSRTASSRHRATSDHSVAAGNLKFVPWPDESTLPQGLGPSARSDESSAASGAATESPPPRRTRLPSHPASSAATPPERSERAAAKHRAGRRALASLGPAWGSLLPSTPGNVADAANTPSPYVGKEAGKSAPSSVRRASRRNASPLSQDRVVAPPPPQEVSVNSILRWVLGGGGIDEAGSTSGHGHDSLPLLSLLKKRLSPPLFEWALEYNWRKSLSSDVTAGVTIGVLLVPQGLACAALSGVPSSHGLWSAFPAVIYAIFGASAHAAIGPMSIPSLLVASGVEDVLTARTLAGAPMPTMEERTRLAIATTFLSGALLLLMGILQLGFVVRFLSRPVLSGFTAAAAVLTMLSSVKDLSGAPVKARAATLPDLTTAVAVAAPRAHALSTVLGLLTLLSLYGMSRAPQCARLRAFMPPALVVVAMSVIIMFIAMRIGGDAGRNGATSGGISLVGIVPPTLPAVWLPWLEVSYEDLRALAPTALSVAIVGFVESIAVAKLYAQKHGYDVSATGELLALGVTNVTGAVGARALVCMGAFGRSAVNNAAGARSQVSGLVSAVTVAICLGAVAPALFFLPKPVLAAVIIFSVSALIDVRSATLLWAADRRDFFVYLAALIATLVLGVSLGVAAAAALSLVVFMAITTQPRVEELGRVTGTVVYRHLGMVGVQPVIGVKVLRFLAPLFFANVGVLRERIAREVAARAAAPPRFQWAALVVCLASVSSVDSSACQVLIEISADFRSKGLVLVLASANAWVEESFAAAGLTATLAKSVSGGSPPIFQRVHDAVRAVLLERVRPAAPERESAAGAASPAPCADSVLPVARPIVGMLEAAWANVYALARGHPRAVRLTA